MKSSILRKAALAALLPIAAFAAPANAETSAIYAPITEAEVEAAQEAWCGALVAIATEYDNNGHAAASTLAGQIIDSAYGYGMGPVLFKPTLAAPPQTFRTSRDGALSYFVGGDQTFANDGGFALKGWRSCRSENAGILITGSTALSMGNVSMWDSKGNMTMVDKTWGYARGADGNLKIVLHHSSLPYSPE